MSDVHTLVVIGTIGNKRVYVDVPADEAIERYIKVNGDDPHTRKAVEATEVFNITDEFGAYDICARRLPGSRT